MTDSPETLRPPMAAEQEAGGGLYHPGSRTTIPVAIEVFRGDQEILSNAAGVHEGGRPWPADPDRRPYAEMARNYLEIRLAQPVQQAVPPRALAWRRPRSGIRMVAGVADVRIQH